MRKGILFFSSLFLLPTHSYAAKRTNTILARPCTVYIHSRKNNGEQSISYFTTKLRSRAECVTLAQIHYPNYDSDTVRAKRVLYKWNYVPPKKTAFIQKKPVRKKVVASFKRR